MKARYFVALSVLLLGVAVLGLRNNNITAYNFKAQLLERDAKGENIRSEVETELKDYVFSHMNASMQIYLEGAHRRAESRARVESDALVDGSVYEDAARACDREGQLTRENAECVEAYVANRLTEVGEVQVPSAGQFTWTFHSPIWTYDLPGLSLLGAVLSTVAASVVYLRHKLS